MAPSDGMTECRAVGEFGERVASRLRQIRPDVRLWSDGDALADDARIVVVALWRPDYALAADLQRQAHAAGAALLPIVFDGRVIRIGPTARPDGGACVTCLRGRLEQHASHEETIRYADEIVRYESFGLRGFLPHHASIAAAIASTRIDEALTEESRERAHLVHTVQVDRLDVAEDVLVQLPGCPDCPDATVPSRELAAVS